MPPKLGKKRARKDSDETVAGPQAPPPIIFTSPGLRSDTRLTVFDQEYHVHSLILKLHSNFFRKVLDSLDKSNAEPASTVFRYEYVSAIELDGTWTLESASKAPTITEDMIAHVPKASSQKEAFRKLLCAMYNRPYRIDDVAEFETITSLADFYGALPILSGTLSGALLGSPMLKRDLDPEQHAYNDFARKAGRIIFVAKKLRHIALFQECFIHLASNLHDKEYIGDEVAQLREDKDLWLLLTEGHGRIRELLLRAHQALIVSTLQRYWSPGPLPKITDEAPEENAMFFKSLKEQITNHISRGVDEPHIKKLSSTVDELMRNNLVLDQTGFGAGEGPYKWCFLCANVRDEDVPWDAEETDW